MKAETEVRNRLRGLLVQELDRRTSEAGQRLPRSCAHNHQQQLDFRKTVGGALNTSYNCVSAEGSPEIGLCFHGVQDPKSWSGDICEDVVDAQRCPYFSPKLGREEILVQFRRDLASPGWISENLPGVAELLWVLDLAEVLPIPWWRRLWHRFLHIRVEPVAKAKKVEDLLSTS